MSAVAAGPLPKTRGLGFTLGWATATQLVTTVVKFGSTLLLTRLLAPEAYALIGMAMVILTTLEWLSDYGVTPALVRHPRGGEAAWLLAGWRANFKRGLLLSAVAASLAVPMAAFYQQPELLGVLLALAARPLLMALRSPGMPLLRRNMEYRALFVDELTQTLVGAGCAIVVAATVSGASAWALVAGTLVGAAAGVVTSYLLTPLAPRWHYDPEAAQELYRLGGRVLVNTLVMALWLNLDRLIGPRFLPLEAMGWYIVAYNLALTVEAFIIRKVDVYFALLSRLSPEERVAWHHANIGRVMRFAGVTLAMAAAAAPLAVKVIYDSRYQPVGLLLAILSARLVFRTLGQLDFQLLLANGDVRTGTAAYAAGLVCQGTLVITLVCVLGVYGLAISLLLTTAIVTATQAVLSPELQRGMIRRFFIASGWAGVGLIGGVLTHWALG
ncbi:MAG: oligosaccharide flippase family protein [Gemmataceae bacterium]